MHNNSPEQMPVLTHAPAEDVRARLKLEGGKALKMHTEFDPAFKSTIFGPFRLTNHFARFAKLANFSTFGSCLVFGITTLF